MLAEHGISLGPSLASLNDLQPPHIPPRWFWELSMPVDNSRHLANSDVCHICFSKQNKTKNPTLTHWADVSFCSSFMNITPSPCLTSSQSPWEISGALVSMLKGPPSPDIP